MSRSHLNVLAAAVLLGTVFGGSNFAAAIDTISPTPPAAQTAAPAASTPDATQPASATHKARKKAHKKPKTTASENLVSGGLSVRIPRRPHAGL